MSNLSTKLIDGIKSKINHKITNLQIDDLIDHFVIDKQFNQELFKEFLKEDLIEQEEEESSLLRFLELFKRDMLLSFTNTSLGKDIPSLATNHVYDKFSNEYYSTMHNEFHTRLAKTTSYLISIFLNVAKTPIQKEEVVNILMKLKKDLSGDQTAEQKFFTIFSIVNNLIKLITVDKNYNEFFNNIDSYTEKMKTFVKDSPFTVYLVRDNIIELSNTIVTHLINSQLEDKYKKKGIVAIFKLATCFKLLDLHLEFIEQIVKHGYEYNLREEFSDLIEQIFSYTLGNAYTKTDTSSMDKFIVAKDFGIDVGYVVDSSYATDGTYIYVHQKDKGLFKIGTGRNNTVQGKVYRKNEKFKIESDGSLAYACGKLYYRAPETKPDPFACVDPNSLQEIPIQFEDGQEKYHFIDREPIPAEIPYTLQGHQLLDPKRSTLPSRIISEGRLLYLISKIGEMKVIDNANEGIYPGNCLFNVDIFDPLRKCEYVASFPLTDPKGILSQSKHSSAFVSESLVNDIVTDGNLMVFINPSAHVAYNMISRSFTYIDESEKNSFRHILDPYGSKILSFRGNESSQLECLASKIPAVNLFNKDMMGGYHPLNTFIPSSIKTHEMFSIRSTTGKVIGKEKELYDAFFSGNKMSLDQKSDEKEYDHMSNTAVLLSILSQGCQKKLHFSDLNTLTPLSHVFCSHILNFNIKGVRKLYDVYSIFMEKFLTNHSVENQSFIISSLLSLFNAHMHQMVLFQFDKFPNFKTDFSFMKKVVEDSIFFIHEIINMGDHYTGISIDLISQSLQIVENYACLFEIDYPNMASLLNILTKDLPSLIDLKRSTLIAISKCPKTFSSSENIKSLCEMLEILLQRNDNMVLEQIEKIVLSTPETAAPNSIEYEKDYEGLLTPFLKILFDAYYRISSNSKDDVEREKNISDFKQLMNQFENVMKLLFDHMKRLFVAVDECLHRAKIEDVINYDRISQSIQSIFDQSCYSYRLFYSSILLLQVLSKDKFVIYKTWHYFIDLLLGFDKSLKANQKEYFELISKEEKERFANADLSTYDKLDWVIETQHPLSKKVEVYFKSEFKRPYDIHVDFDPLSIKKDAEFKIICKTISGEISETFSEGFNNKTLKNVTDIEVTYNGYPNTSYGIKVHIHNGKKYTHVFNNLLTATTSIIINSIKTFFFFNYSKDEKNDKDVEELLQSKLFSGGIDELLDLQSFSEEYQNFISLLKDSGNYQMFETKLSTEGDLAEENERVPFEMEEIMNKANISVEKFIEYAQIALKPRFPWITIGGDNAGSIVRGAFSVLMKQEKLYDLVSDVAGKIIEMEDANKGKKLSFKEFSKIENFDYLLLIWSEVSRLRQWYQEQVKDLAESKKDDFDKQNEEFVKSVIDKCNFLFQINPPKSPKKSKWAKVNFLELFAKSELLSTQKIDNDLLMTNIIKFKKNLMQGKMEQGNQEIENTKKNIQSVVNCIKLTKITIVSLKNALRDMNTKAKFREIALSLMNTILSDVETTDIKLFIVKQIIQTLRLTSGKRIGSIDDEIKSASPSILSLITRRFHEFIRLIFGGLLSSDSEYYINSFMDCLFWNYKARDHKVLIEVGIFENLYIHSPNETIKEAWKLIAKLKMKNPYKKSSNKYEHSLQFLCSNMLELFHILSTTVAARVIDETHSSSEFNEQASGFAKKKSSIFDNSFERLIENISYIIQQRLEEYLENYVSLIKNLAKYQKEFLSKENKSDRFQSEYFNETFLTVFLLLIYKFNVNHSPHILKYMKSPEFLSALLILLRFTSTKNKLPLVNILKVYLNDLKDEDIDNLAIFLKKKELLKLSLSNAKFYSKDIEAIPGRKFICLYLLESLYLLRKGIHEKNTITLSHEYEEGMHLINLIRFMYGDSKWSPIFDEVFVDYVSNFSYTKDTPEAFATVSQILSVLNGDFDDIHYGSKVLLKYKSDYSKTITEKYRDRTDELSSCANGFVLGFCADDIKINDLKTNHDLKEFIYEKLHSKRMSSDKYVLLITFEKDSYSKNKLRSNDVEFQTKNIQDIILCPEIDFIITNKNLIECLTTKFNDILAIISNNENLTLYELYMFIQISKSINSIFSAKNKELTDYLLSNISLDKLKPLIENILNEKYTCIKSNQLLFMNMLKFYLDGKTMIGFELHDKVEGDEAKVSISCEGLRTLRKLRIFRGSAYNGKVLQILASNITVDSDSFAQLNKLKVCKFGDSRMKNFMNCLLLSDLEKDEVCEKLAKIDDINFCVLVSKKDLGCAKDKIHHPYIVVNNEFDELDGIITHFETKPKESLANVKTLESLDPNVGTIIEKIRKQTFTAVEEDTKIKFAPCNSINPLEIVQAEQAKIAQKPTTVGKKDFQKAMQRLLKNYIRFFVIHLISEHPEVITADNYDFIKKQFKIAYLDACGISNLTIFSYQKFVYVMNLLSRLIEKEEEIKPKENLINIQMKSKIFNSYNFSITEVDICDNVQSELVDFFYENELFKQANNLSIEIYFDLIMKVTKLSIITINYESKTFIQYLDKLQELISKLFSFIAVNSSSTTQEKIEEMTRKLRKDGLDQLFNYVCDSIAEEKGSFSVRTKKLINFCYEYSRMYTEMFKKAWNVYKAILFDDLPNSSKLSDLLYQINLLCYKARYPELKDRLILQSPDVKAKLTTEFEIPYRELSMEVTLNYKNTKKFRLTPKMTESKGKTLVVAELKDNGKYNIGEMVEDIDHSAITLSPGKKLLVANAESIKHELWMCGYNEHFRLGNDTLSDYTNYYAPVQAMIDKNIKIHKVVNLPTSTVVISSDGRIFVAGDGTNSGVSSQCKTFSLENKWNNNAKKDKVIDFASNENSGAIMVTQKGVWVSGYNSSNCFGDACPSGNNTSDVIQWNISVFNVKKVVEVSLGYCHSVFRLDDGSVYGTGCNNEFDICLPTQTYITTPTKLPFEGVKCLKVSCGYHTTLFIIKERDGTQRLYSSGYNCYGQNGQGTSSNYQCKKCLGVEDVQFRFVKIGYYSCCAITVDNKLYTWGYCGYSNLAQPDTSNRYQPSLSEFFSNKQVLEADICERNLTVKAIDPDGTIKLWTAGYNGSGLISIGESNSNYYNVPMEVTAFKDAFVYKFFTCGPPYALSFVKSSVDSLQNPFVFKCALCSLNSSSTLIINDKKSICIDCFKSKEELKVSFGVRGCSIKDTEALALPDLTEINKLEIKNSHGISCYECNQIISNGIAYIVADTIASQMIAFCGNCYPISCYFDVPKLVYLVKGEMDYSILPNLENGSSLLGYDNDKALKFSKFQYLNEDGKKVFYQECTDLFTKINKEYDEIRSEYIIEYLKLLESTSNDRKKVAEEIKKNQSLNKLTQGQIEIIEHLVDKLDCALKEVRKYVHMDAENIVKDIYITNLPFMSKASRMEFFEKIIYEEGNDVSSGSLSLRLSRGKAYKFKQKPQIDYQGNYTIFGQAFQQLKKAPLSQFKGKKNNRMFCAELVGEGATDAGGPYREMMNIMMEELQSPWIDLFIPTPNNKSSSGQDREKWTVNPSAKSNTHLEMFTVLGRLMGFAARSLGYLTLNLPSYVWKQILEQPLDLNDLEKIDIHTANFLEDLMNLEAKGIDKEQFESIYDQPFTTILSNGKEVEVQAGGNSEKVTYENAQEYVRLALKTRFEEAKVQIEALKTGFFEVIKKDITLLINWKDLEERVCGSLIVDVELLKKNTDYESWSSTDQVITWFWQAFEKFSNEERILYLKFVWGRSRLPLSAEGFDRKHRMTRAYSSHPDISLPLSHTCFFTIDIPPYSSYDILYNKLLYAIKFCNEIDNDYTTSSALEDL